MAITFEDILPWGTTGGDTGLSARLKLKRNFEKIRLWTDAVPGQYQPKGSYVETEGDRMTGSLLMDNCQLQFGTIQTYIENSSDKLKLHGKEGILLDGNTFLGSGNALKSLEANADLIAYKSVDEGETINGVTVNHWFVGTGVQGVFRSNNPLVRYDGTDSFTIWDSSNLTPSNYLARTGGTLRGPLTFADSNGNSYGAIRAEKIGNGEYLYLWGNDGVLIDGLSVRKDNAIVPIENVFLSLAGGTMEPGATITLQELVNNIPVETLVASRRWVNAQGFLTSHQSLANYVTLDGTETITGQKTFGGIVNLQSDVYVTPTGTLYLQTYDSASRPVSSPAASQSWVSSQGFLTSHQSLADYATTSQLNTGLAAKQNKIHFLNRNNNNTESDFSYLYLPLMNVSGGYAELDCVTLSGQQTISGAKTFSADVTHSGTSKAKFGSLSSIYENSSNVLVLTGGNGIELNDDTNVGNGYQLTFNNNNGVSNLADSNSDYLLLWGADGVIIDDIAFIRENNELWKLATESWVENCIGSAATLTIAQVTSSDQKVVTSGMTFTAYNGTYLLEGNGNNNGKIVLRARFTASETCLVKVTLTASSEANYDFGVVGLLDDDDLSSNNGSIGNKILAKASGNNTIVTKFVEVPAGDHYFEIGYVKDGSQSTYDDCATIKIEKVRTAFDCPTKSEVGTVMTGIDFLPNGQVSVYTKNVGNGTPGQGNLVQAPYFLSAGGTITGSVGIGTAPASGYWLDIDGAARATRWDTSSDERLKDVTERLEPSAEAIAAAPIVTFRWKEGDGNENLGTLAQYWQTVFPQAVHEGVDGLLSMEYSTIALASAVTAARKAVALEQRVSELERLLATK